MIRPPKSVLLQYVYDYGLDKAAALFHIDTETADKIINWKPQYDQYSYNTVIDKPLHRNASKIADIIAKHYPELVKQYTIYYKDNIYMSQTVEDFLQKAVIRCMSLASLNSFHLLDWYIFCLSSLLNVLEGCLFGFFRYGI